jgi:exonuclease VII large subunit
MVQPSEIPNDEAVNNIIDQASAELDQELANTGVSGAQPPTAEEVQKLQQDLAQTQNEIRGLQSLYDRGLNAIRRDSEEKLQQIQRESQMQQSQARRDQYLGSLDERERSLVEPLMNEIDTMRQSYVQSLAYQQPVQGSQQSPVETPHDQWEAVYKVVENMGVSRNDTNVNYQVLMDATKTDDQKQEVFFASVRDAVTRQGQPTPQAPVTQAVDPQVQTPPVENGRQGSAEGAQNLDQLMDWWLPLQNPTEQQKEDYRRKLDQFQ